MKGKKKIKGEKKLVIYNLNNIFKGLGPLP
jgi:hypothetical protein